MRRRMSQLVVVLGLLSMAVLRLGVQPGRAQQRERDWTRITEGNSPNTAELAFARTEDGVLHVIWSRHEGRIVSYMHSAIGEDGRLRGAPVPVVENWGSLNLPALIVTESGGLELLFGGLRTAQTSDAYSRGCLYRATSDSGGTAWTLEKGCGSSSSSIYASGLGATVAPDGTPVVVWGANVQVGLGENLKERKFLTKGCCSYAGQAATDSVSGEVVAGWHSNADDAHGLYTVTVLPSFGEVTYVPGSARADRKSSLSLSTRLPITARRGAAGVYVGFCEGYPVCESINVWKHSDSEARVVAKARAPRHVNIAPGPEGRLWLMWMQRQQLFAVRSNRAATRFGPVLTVAPPKGTSSVWRLMGEGALGPLDFFAHVSTPDSLATWHTQVFPPLSLTASPTNVMAENGGSITFTVSDVGDPVEGATITVEGKKLTTDTAGRATFSVPKGSKPGALAAKAQKEGYTDASAKVTLAPKSPPKH